MKKVLLIWVFIILIGISFISAENLGTCGDCLDIGCCSSETYEDCDISWVCTAVDDSNNLLYDCSDENGCIDSLMQVNFVGDVVEGKGDYELCGDNKIDPGEECDDGNTQDNDGCSSDCMNEKGDYGMCGNSVIDDGEQCDDGNTQDNDGCSSLCQTEYEYCGDGTKNEGEECDDGNRVDGDGCDKDCKEECVEETCKSYFKEGVFGRKYYTEEDCKKPCKFSEVSSGLLGRKTGVCSCEKDEEEKSCDCGECVENCQCGEVKEGSWNAVDWSQEGNYKVKSFPKDYLSSLEEVLKSLEDGKNEINEKGTYQGDEISEEAKPAYLEQIESAIVLYKGYLEAFNSDDIEKKTDSFYKGVIGQNPLVMFIFYNGCEKADDFFEKEFKSIIEKYSKPEIDGENIKPYDDPDYILEIQFWTVDISCSDNLKIINKLNEKYNLNDENHKDPVSVSIRSKMKGLETYGMQFEKTLKLTISLLAQYNKMKDEGNILDNMPDGFLKSVIGGLPSLGMGGATSLLGIDTEQATKVALGLFDMKSKSPCIGLALYTSKHGNFLNFIPIKFPTSAGSSLDESEMKEFHKQFLIQINEKPELFF